MTILNKTLNFYQLYQHCMGRSEVPQLYHYWCCMSLLSAVLEDRVWYEFYKDDPLYPNLYIMLLGPSGVAKGLAIGNAVRLLDSCNNVTVNKHRGPITAPRLIDKLGGVGDGVDGDGQCLIQDAKMWLIFDELANDVAAGGPVMTQNFLKMMTELYTGHYVFDSGTRMHGDVTVDGACLTWLVGTTSSWLKKVLTRDMVDSGFTPRVLPVVSGYVDERVVWPEYAVDHDAVYEHLKSRLYTLKHLTGAFVLSEPAKREYEGWYGAREAPADEVARAFFQRERALMFKLAMLAAVMDPGPMVITGAHVRMALHHVRYAAQWHDKLVVSANSTPDSEDIDVVQGVLERRMQMGHTELLRAVQRQMNTERVKRAMRDLVQRGDVMQGVKKGGGVVYTWRG